MADDAGPIGPLIDSATAIITVGDPEYIAYILNGWAGLMDAEEHGLVAIADELGSQGMTEQSQHLYAMAAQLHAVGEMANEAIITGLVGWILRR